MVEEGHTSPERDHPAETNPAPGQVAFRSHSHGLTREQGSERKLQQNQTINWNCSSVSSQCHYISTRYTGGEHYMLENKENQVNW